VLLTPSFLVAAAALGATIYAACEATDVQGCSYRLGPKGLWIWHFGLIPGRFIPYDSILEVRPATIYEAVLGQTHGMLLRRGVRLELNSGFWRVVVVTPTIPRDFIAEIRAHVPGRVRL